jgi:hypothetical protein
MLFTIEKSWDSSVGIVKGCVLNGLGSISSKSKFCFSYASSKPALGPTQPPIQWVPGGFSWRVKRPGREVNLSLIAIAKVKNGGAIPPLLYISYGLMSN